MHENSWEKKKENKSIDVSQYFLQLLIPTLLVLGPVLAVMSHYLHFERSIPPFVFRHRTEAAQQPSQPTDPTIALKLPCSGSLTTF